MPRRVDVGAKCRRLLSYRRAVAKPIPASGLDRWLYFGGAVVKRGVPPVWTTLGIVVGVSLVAVLHFLASLSALWIIVAVLGACLIVLAVGSYRVWSALEARPLLERSFSLNLRRSR